MRPTKILLIIAIVFLIGIITSSCSNKYTCPTYSKVSIKFDKLC